MTIPKWLKSIKRADEMLFTAFLIAFIALHDQVHSQLYIQTSIFAMLLSVYFALSHKQAVITGVSLLQVCLIVKLGVMESENRTAIFLCQSVILVVLCCSGFAKLVYRLISSFTLTAYKILMASLFISTFMIQEDFKQSGLVGYALVFALFGGFLMLRINARYFKLIPIFLIGFGIMAIVVILLGGHTIVQFTPFKVFDSAQILVLTPLKNALKAEVIAKGLLLALATLADSLMTIKDLSSRNDKLTYNRLMPNLLVTNFIGVLFGFLPIALPITSNSVLSCKKLKNSRALSTQILVTALFIFLMLIGKFTSSMAHNLLMLILSQVILVSNLVKFKELNFIFRNSKFRFTALIIFSVLSVMLKNTIPLFVAVFFVEVMIYLFSVQKIFGFNKNLLYQAPIDIQRDLIYRSRDSLVYTLEGGFNFLFTGRHIKKIKKSDSMEIIVDFSTVMSQSDLFYIESYKEMVAELGQLDHRILSFYKLPMAWNKHAMKKTEENYQLKQF